jgi:hypothetical protein
MASVAADMAKDCPYDSEPKLKKVGLILSPQQE